MCGCIVYKLLSTSAIVQDYSSNMKIVGLSLLYSQLNMYEVLR
jgi:hypothetical protein